MYTSVLLIACLATGQTEAAAPDDLIPKVRGLVRELNSTELARRETAEQGLIELGPAVLDLLDQIPIARLPAETRQRLARVRGVLQRAAAKAATMASLVTLSAEEMPLSQILAALDEQTGNKTIDYRERFLQDAPDVPVSVSFDKTPYWQALDQILDRAKLTVYNYGEEAGAIPLVTRPDDVVPRSGRAFYQGVFRFEATRIQATRDLRNPAGRGLTLTVEIAWEPRIAPISLSLPLDKIGAVDRAGNAVPVAGQSQELEVGSARTTPVVELEIPLELPDRDVREIASLTGTMVAVIPGRVETYEFVNLLDAKDVVNRRAGVTVILQTFRKNDDVYEARILVRFDKAANALESHRDWISNNEAYLVDPSGEKLDNLGMATTQQGANEIGLAYMFVLDGEPAGHKFVYRTPAAIVKMPIEFELKGIELP